VPVTVIELALVEPVITPATIQAVPLTAIGPSFPDAAITVDPVPVVVIDPPWAGDTHDAIKFATADAVMAIRAPSVFAPEWHARMADPRAPVIDMSLVVPIPMCSHAMIPQPALPLAAVMFGAGVAPPELVVAMMPTETDAVGVGQAVAPSVKHPDDGVRSARPSARPTPMFVPSKYSPSCGVAENVYDGVVAVVVGAKSGNDTTPVGRKVPTPLAVRPTA
jgi:hypothetical protein